MGDKILRNYRKYLRWSTFSNKLVIFVLGVIVGCILSFIVINIPKDFLKSKQVLELAIDEPEFDPFAQFKIPLNDRINAKIRYYLRPGRKADLADGYKRSGRYLPMIKAIFEEYNLPQVLVYLPILESGFLPNRKSRAGAVGLWQIMAATAFDYGLKFNRWIDERRDPEKSTIVAAEYLQFLYDKFGDWNLALAAYNGGYPKIRRAMKREKASNFWKLRRIPRETYNFVPNFWAILHILADPDKYGVKLPRRDEPLDYETIDIEATFSIEQIAKLANVTPKVIKRFNPALTGNIAPSGKYSIRVPAGVKEHFLKRYKESPPDRVEITYTTYRVKKGDTLYEIAKTFGTTVNAIKADNNLRSTRWIKIGMLLRIALFTVNERSGIDINVNDLPNTSDSNKVKLVYKVQRGGLSVNTLARYYSVTVDEVKSWNRWLRTEKLQIGQEVDIYKSTDNISMHKTRRGDSLWRLARRYNTTVGNLRRWNQIRGSKIYPGQSIIVKLE